MKMLYLEKELSNTVPSRYTSKQKLLERKMHALEREEVEKFQVVPILQSLHLDGPWLVVNLDLNLKVNKN